MTAILFILILLVLIFVHELGHFLAAKWAGIKVSEFALGFPPKIASWKRGETTYSLNIVPFGGFVRIHGENPLEDVLPDDPDRDRNMAHKPWYIQAWVLIAGITFNILFAWILISISFMFGYPTAVDESVDTPVQNPRIMILSVTEDGPAMKAGIKAGEVIVGVESGNNSIVPKNVSEVRKIISETATMTSVIVTLEKDNATRSVEIYPSLGIVENKPAIGISMSVVGTIKYAPHIAVYEGLKTTGNILVGTAKGLGDLVYQSVRGQASLDSVSGPIGIAGMVGNASQFGLFYLLGFTALISINLAVINLVPFPALDGGRLLIVLIEAITRRKVPSVVQAYANGIGFILLIGLMILVTIGDITKLFRS